MMRVSSVFLSLILFSLSAYAVERAVPENRAQAVLSFSPIVKKTSPAVVNIYTKKKISVQVNPLLNDPVFRHFFGDALQGGMREKVQSSLGSGVIVRADGLIVTNNHVIKGGEEIRVVLHDRREFAAKQLLVDEKSDLALLKISDGDEKFPYLSIADSDQLEIGDMVLAIGNPFGVGQTVTSGIISALARTGVSASDYQFFIQTDAAINPGNSGGALVNMNGELIGINTAILSGSGGSVGIGFAIPTTMVSSLIKTLEKGGKVVHPWLGVSTQTITQELANSLQLKTPQGVLISRVFPGSPCEAAGIKQGDVIIGMDGHVVEEEQALRYRVATYEPGAKVRVDYIRAGEKLSATLTLIAPPEIPARDPVMLKGEQPLSGASIENISPAVATQMNLPLSASGVVVREVKNGIAAQLGVAPGDIIKRVNDQPVTSTRQLEKLLAKPASRWTIQIQRGDQVVNVNVGSR